MLRDGVLAETVYVPPSSLRGRLRHLLTTELMRMQHAADGRVFTPEDYIDTALGGVKDRKAEGEDERKVDLKAIRELRVQNPIVSLFGSMVSGVAGRLMVGDMTPIEPVQPTNSGRSVRANPFVRNPAIVDLLDPARFDEFTRLNELRIEAKRVEEAAKRMKQTLAADKRRGRVDDAKAGAAEAEIKALETKAKEGFREAGGAVNVQQPLDGYDLIPEGTRMANRVRLLDGTEVEVALLLLALDLLAKRPLIGGHTAHGCGEIAGEWHARVRDDAGLRDAGKLRLEPFVGLAAEGLAPALDAAFQRAMHFAQEVVCYDFRAA